MPIAAYALIACGLLAFGNWMQFQHGQTLAVEAAQTALERDQAVADAQAARDQGARVAAAQEVLAAKITTLRSNYEKRVRDLSRIPDGPDGCLDRPLAAPVDELLKSADPAAPGPAPAPNARPATGARLGGQDVPRLGGLYAALAGKCPVVGGRQSRGALCT